MRSIFTIMSTTAMLISIWFLYETPVKNEDSLLWAIVFILVAIYYQGEARDS